MPIRSARVALPSLGSALLAAAAAVTLGCSGPAGASVTTPMGGAAAASEVPTHALAAPSDTYGSVIVREGAPYLFVSLEFGSSRLLEAGVPIPAECQMPPEGNEACALSYPASDALRANAEPAPASVELLTPTGPCTAEVGDVMVLVTGNCQESYTVVRPLTGCTGAVAPVARLSGLWDANLRFLPTPALENIELEAGVEPTSAHPEHSARVQAWMAEEVIRSQPLAEGVASYVSLDVGGDQLETSAAGFLLGNPEPECEQTIEQRMSSFLRRDGALIPVAELQEWDGVIAWRGRVVGVVAGLPHDRRLLSVTGTGELREEFNERVWSDNDECEAFGWALVQYPCGP